MTVAVKRSMMDQPGRMESHPAYRIQARPHCTLQELDPEDLDQTMCEILPSDDKRLLVRTDEASFKLQVEFVHAHGVPKGEFTTFITGGTRERPET